MTTEELEQIAKLLEPLKQGQERLEQGQARLEKGHLQHATASETLAEGVQDIRKHMVTKADNFTYFAPIERNGYNNIKWWRLGEMSVIFWVFHSHPPFNVALPRNVQSNTRRINALEEKIGSHNPDKH